MAPVLAHQRALLPEAHRIVILFKKCFLKYECFIFAGLALVLLHFHHSEFELSVLPSGIQWWHYDCFGCLFKVNKITVDWLFWGQSGEANGLAGCGEIHKHFESKLILYNPLFWYNNNDHQYCLWSSLLVPFIFFFYPTPIPALGLHSHSFLAFHSF